MSVSKTLDKIIKPEYRERFADWQKYASEKDLFGLQLIEQIYKSKGTHLLDVCHPFQKQMYDTQESLMKRKSRHTLQEAQQNFRRKQITTSYQFYHGGYSAPKQIKNVFQFRPLDKLNISKPLNSKTCNYINKWLNLKDSKKNQQSVLQCLRSFNSKMHVCDPKSTQMKTMYDWKNDWNLTKPVRVDQAGKQLFAFKPNLTAISKQEEKKRQHRQKIKELEQTQFAKQLTIFKDFKIN